MEALASDISETVPGLCREVLKLMASFIGRISANILTLSVVKPSDCCETLYACCSKFVKGYGKPNRSWFPSLPYWGAGCFYLVCIWMN